MQNKAFILIEDVLLLQNFYQSAVKNTPSSWRLEHVFDNVTDAFMHVKKRTCSCAGVLMDVRVKLARGDPAPPLNTPQPYGFELLKWMANCATAKNVPVVAYSRFLYPGSPTAVAANLAWESFEILLDVIPMAIEGEDLVKRAYNLFDCFHATRQRPQRPSFW